MPAPPRSAAFAVAAVAKIHNPTPGVSGGVDQGAYESKGNDWIRKTYVSATYDAAMPAMHESACRSMPACHPERAPCTFAPVAAALREAHTDSSS
jgi:hypothetical protein